MNESVTPKVHGTLIENGGNQLMLIPEDELKRIDRLTDGEDFDWNKADSLIPEQAETAVYINPNGGVVIRQRGWPDDDVYVVIAPENLHVVIDRLCDIAGIGSARP